MTVALCRRAARPLVVVAVIGGASAALHGLAAQSAPAPAPEVTAIGCVAQLLDTATAPPTGHEQGAATGLTLTRARVTLRDARGASAPPRSAVPGSLPGGSGSGTTPDNVAKSGAATVEQSLWVVGTKSAELTRFVGKRVEVVGVIDTRLEPNPGTPHVTDAGAAAARRSTAAQPEPPALAHPSAPTRALSVTSFRVLDEACS